jgi:predicted DNA-binding protein with PD1-like motif
MKITLFALTFLAATAALAAQETRTETTSPATADDARPNSDQVPAVYALAGKFDRILVLRFKYQTDLLTSLEGIVKQEKVRNAVILAGAGSVCGYTYHTVSNREFPTKNMHVSNPTGPADIVSMNGYVIDGRVHAHITFANANSAFGGHLESPTTVFTFAIVTLGVLDDRTDLGRVDDKAYR